jgi:tungstate transport system ATP-binding protein
MAVARMRSPLYRLSGVSKRYNQGFNIHIETLDIPRSGIFALLGPNGAGKSTLLRLLHFLEPVEAGEIQFRGEAISYPPVLAVRRRIAMVFQKPVMLSGSVRQNILYGMRLRKSINQTRLETLLKELDLGHLANESAKTLSGGEAQRVALARALATQPEVLLLDEPTANLDPYNIRLIEHIIKRAADQDGTSTILVTHDVFQVRRLADSAAFIVGGQLVEVGAIDDFFDHPEDPRTRTYLQGELVG